MATKVTNEHVEETKVDDSTKNVDEVSITKPFDVEVKNATAEVENPAVVEAGALKPEDQLNSKGNAILDEELKGESEDDKSTSKQPTEPENSSENSSMDGMLYFDVHESSKEGAENQVEVMQEPEHEAIKEPIASETVVEEIKKLEQPLEVSSEPDTASKLEDEKVEPVTTSISNDTITTGIDKDEKLAASPCEVNSESTNEEARQNDQLEQIIENTNNQTHEVVGSDNSVMTDPTEVTNTKVTEGTLVPVVTDVADTSKVPEGLVNSKDSVPSNAVAIEESANDIPVDGNSEGTIEEDVKVEQEKQEDSVEVEKSPVSQEEKPIFESTNQILSPGDKPDLIIKNSSEEPQETIEKEISASIGSTLVTDSKEVGEGVAAEVVDIVEKTDGNASTIVDAASDAVGVSVLSSVESFDTVPVSENAGDKQQEDLLVIKEENTPEVEKSTIVETVETFADNNIAEVVEEAKASVTEVLIDKANSVREKTELVKASRDFDVAGVVNKAHATEGEAKEAQPKAIEAKQTLRDKFVSETSESETAQAAEKGATETNKDSGNPKTDEKVSKQDIPSKISHRNSNMLLKLKQSIIKVKKAIIGKSPSSKTTQADAKDDTKAK